MSGWVEKKGNEWVGGGERESVSEPAKEYFTKIAKYQMRCVVFDKKTEYEYLVIIVVI